ncbi:hypothetical protein CPB85DRAFT_14801 [Mucidula mucida]|nr:hypothetical protein CPB85DRAFT_14801 [Mucidula mucida]
MATIFKLNRASETRRLSFNQLPSWDVLSEKIHTLYGIPEDNMIGLTYVDSDGDNITLSSNGELADFYQSSYRPGDVIKFVVQDLRQSRAASESLRSFPETPTDSNSRRNTFGKDPLLQFHIDEDWQSIPAFSNMFHPAQSPEHGFIESVTTMTDDDATAIPTTDKGKGRAYTPSFHSTTSSVNGDVEMLTSTPKAPISDFGPFPQDKELPNLYSVASSTPRMENPPLKRSQNSVIPFVGKDSAKGSTKSNSHVPTPTHRPATPVASSDEEDPAPDPPLAPLENPTPPNLANDIASLLDAVSTVFNAHPEVSEGFQNLIRNAASGTYLGAHRDAIARAASAYSQTAQTEFSRAEADAGRRVSEALASLARTVAQAAGVSSEEANHPRDDPDSFGNDGGAWWTHGPPPPPPGGFPPFPPPGPHHGPPFPGFDAPFGQFGRGRGGGRGGGRGRGGPFGHFGPHAHPHHHGPRHGPPPRGPPPPPHGMYPPFHPGPPEFFNPPSPAGPLDPNRVKELRAEVEAAKLLYKKQKERYRQDRAERHRLKQMQLEEAQQAESSLPQEDQVMEDSSVLPPASPRPASFSQLVSQARGRFPEVDLVGVAPKRSNTHSGFITGKDRAIGRITRKLADMGFTEAAHPNMASTIRSHVPEHGEVSKEVEDNIVTTFIEELEEEEPKEVQPRASGSSSLNQKW